MKAIIIERYWINEKLFLPSVQFTVCRATVTEAQKGKQKGKCDLVVYCGGLAVADAGFLCTYYDSMAAPSYTGELQERNKDRAQAEHYAMRFLFPRLDRECSTVGTFGKNM